MTTSGQIKRYTINSRFLDEERGFWVYYPAEYDPGRAYPVLYAHDGEDYLNMGRIRTIVNNLSAEGKLQSLVMVGIQVEKRHRTAEYHPEGERHRAYTLFITEELIPFVEGRSELGVRSHERATIGSSLGAVVGCQLAWQHPGVFQTVVSQSGAFYKPTTTEAMQSVHSSEDIRYYVMVGLDETNVSTSAGVVDLLEANRQFHRQLEAKGSPCIYEEYPGNHTWGLWQKNLPIALTHFWGN